MVVAAIQDLAAVVKSGGGGNCTRGSSDARNLAVCTYGECHLGLSEECREDASLAELLEKWPSLPDHIRCAIMHLVRVG